MFLYLEAEDQLDTGARFIEASEQDPREGKRGGGRKGGGRGGGHGRCFLHTRKNKKSWPSIASLCWCRERMCVHFGWVAWVAYTTLATPCRVVSVKKTKFSWLLCKMPRGMGSVFELIGPLSIFCE